MRLSEERTLWLTRWILPHEPALRAWLSRRRLFDLEVDDVVQEAYARLAAAPSVDDIRNAKAYFFQVARSVIASHVRRGQIVSFLAVENLKNWDVESEDALPDTVTADRDELLRVAEILSKMPRQLAAVFKLRRIEGLSQSETAAKLGLAESTVEKHMAKSLRLFMEAAEHGGFSRSQASKVKATPDRREHGKTGEKS